MSAPSWENLDDFLGTDENGGFATPAVFTLADGTVRPAVNVIFDDPRLDAELGEYVAETTDPFVTGKESDLRGIRRGDMVTVNGREFDVLSSPRPDGTGMALVRLAPVDA